MREKFLEIVRMAMEVREHRTPGGPDVFVYWMPHINAMDVSIYRDGWSKTDSGADMKFTLYADGTYSGSRYGNADICLKEVKRALEDALELEGMKRDVFKTDADRAACSGGAVVPAGDAAAVVDGMEA